MAWTERYANFDLTTGADDGTSEADAWKTLASMQAGVAAGHRVNIKRQSSPYVSTAAITWNTAGTQTAPIWYRGYSSTIGDGGRWQLELGTTLHHFTSSGAYALLDSIEFNASSGGSNNLDFGSTNHWLLNCKVIQTGTQNPSCGNAINCYFDLGRTRMTGGGTNSYNSTFLNCVFKRDSALAPTTGSEILNFEATNRSILVQNCVFHGDGLSGINGITIGNGSTARFVQFIRNRFYNVNHGISITLEPDAVREDILIHQNVLSTCAGYAINQAAATYLGYVRHFGNAYHSCTSGYTNYPDESVYMPAVSLTNSPFVDPSNGDFSINNDASGGALVTAFGFPIQMPIDTNADAIETLRGSSGSGGWGFRRRPRTVGA